VSTDYISGKVVGKSYLSITCKIDVMSAQKMLIGALTGIVIGILIAPAKGSETRQKISETAENLKEKIRKLRGDTSDELDRLREVVEQETAGLKEETKQKILRLIETSKKSYNHLREAAMSN
jgi:gas vesicle protein